MAEIFNPNAQAYEGQMLSAAQQRKVADMLRQRANQMEVPKAELVGTGPGAQIVNPHWLNYLNPVVAQGMASYYGGKADRAGLSAQDAKLAEEARALDAQQQHADQWRSSLPQAIAAQAQQTAPYMAPGMDGPENIPGTESVTQQAQAAQPVTTEQILKHTLAGLQNPMTRGEAGIYKDVAFKDMEREDKQVESRALMAQNAALARERLEQAAELARQRSEDLRRSEAQRAQDKAEERATRLQIAGMSRSLGNSLSQDRFEYQKDQDIDRSAERLGTEMKTLVPMLKSAQQVQEMFDANEGKSIPGLGYTGVLHSTLISKKGNINRGKVKMFANAMLRDQAGLSQTLSETENAQLEMLSSGKYSEAEFREMWPNLMEKINSTVENYRATYKPEVIQRFEQRGGNLKTVKSKIKPVEAPAAAPVPGAPKARLKYNQATGEFE